MQSDAQPQADEAGGRGWFGQITAPGGQSATFVELFFDLVFVFALTEVTALTLEHLDWEGAARSLLIFWMIWWAWTQWTWALNSSDTEHAIVRIATLAATAVAFIMAASVGLAFEGEQGLWFAIPYVAVRAIGMAIYAVVASGDHVRLIGVRQFSLASIPGMAVVVVGGFMDAEIRGWFWLGAVLLDIGATLVAGGYDDWGLHAGHFAERHALFVIIALGESLIVVGLVFAGAGRDAELVRVAIGAVIITCLLWWTYFGWLKDALELQMEREPSASEGEFARDTFSLLHFPLIGGVIGIAIGFEEMVHHPADAAPADVLVALGLGLALFLGASVLAWLRASGELLWARLGSVAVLGGGLAAAAAAEPVWILALVAVVLASVVAVETVIRPGAQVSAG